MRLVYSRAVGGHDVRFLVLGQCYRLATSLEHRFGKTVCCHAAGAENEGGKTGVYSLLLLVRKSFFTCDQVKKIAALGSSSVR